MPTLLTAPKGQRSLSGTLSMELCPQLSHGMVKGLGDIVLPRAPRLGAPQGVEQAQDHPWERAGKATDHTPRTLGFTHLPRKFKVTVIFWKV